MPYPEDMTAEDIENFEREMTEISNEWDAANDASYTEWLENQFQSE